MNLLIEESVAVVRTHSTCVWMETLPSGSEWYARVHIRGVQGLWYLAAGYRAPRPTSHFLFFDTYSRGIFSARPFFVGLPCDASTDLCVLALLDDLCRDRDLDAADLISRAGVSSHRHSPADLVEARRQADWEHTEFPLRWTAAKVSALCRTLDNPRWAALARLLREVTG
jgi:hypothetical protein